MREERICGFNAAAALFRHRPEAVLRLFYAESQARSVGPWCAALARRKHPYRMLDAAAMQRAAGTAHHGGICAVAAARPVPPLQIDSLPDCDPLLILDGIGNPHNLGAIVRSAAFFGVRALVLHEVPGAAMPCEAAFRTAEGGFEHLALYKTRDLPAMLHGMRARFRTVAACLSPTAQPLSALGRDRAVALVLGHEEHGVSEPVLAACRRHVRIGQGGSMQSLNVAQAAAVLLHALTPAR